MRFRVQLSLVINRGYIPIVGQDILYGEIAKFSIADSLLDGELLDPAPVNKSWVNVLMGKHGNGDV